MTSPNSSSSMHVEEPIVLNIKLRVNQTMPKSLGSESGEGICREGLHRSRRQLSHGLYATIPDHVAYTDSKWMILPLRDDDDSFQNIADEVKRSVHEDMEHQQYQQQCESMNRLNTGALYLQR